jgi:NAD(P)-dependent dehydrogenase (short-subunit alcohol dehydrogenase family)
VNLQTDGAALDELRGRNVFSLPVVAIGSRYLSSPRLEEIDALLGIDSEVASVHLFLCSNLSAYVNGDALVVDGGISVWNGT